MQKNNFLLEINNISQSYNNNSVIKDLSLHLNKGDIGCLLGPSGCGKTTILRCVAGFESIKQGNISLNKEIISSTNHHKNVEKRNIGMVFQDYALFPHLTAKENILFGIRHLSKDSQEKRLKEMFELIDLEHCLNLYAHELSGGQQQRIALARALAPKPDLLLLDEPFSNLDACLKERLCIEIRDILKEAGMTALLITHDQNEAFMIADVIGVMDNGQVKQWDSPYNIYHKPKNRNIAEFIGDGTFITGLVIGKNKIETNTGILKGQLDNNYKSGTMMNILFRPDDIIHDDKSKMKAKIAKKSFRGAQILYTLELENGEYLLSLAPSHHNHEIGENFGYRIECDHIIAFEK